MEGGPFFLVGTCVPSFLGNTTTRGDHMVNREETDNKVIDGIELTKDERQPCEVWTRVMGYYRPVEMYNTGKKGEFHERVEFVEPKL